MPHHDRHAVAAGPSASVGSVGAQARSASAGHRTAAVAAPRRGGRMNRAQSTGLKTSATNSDASRAMITVIGRYFMNSPMIPGQKISGAEGDHRGQGRGDHRAGHLVGAVRRRPPRRPCPCRGAGRCSPRSRCALSTSMPSARIRLNSTTMFRVMPSSAEHDEGDQHREGDGRCPRRARCATPEEGQQHHHHQDQAAEDVVLQLLDHARMSLGLVADDADLGARPGRPAASARWSRGPRRRCR